MNNTSSIHTLRVLSSRPLFSLRAFTTILSLANGTGLRPALFLSSQKTARTMHPMMHPSEDPYTCLRFSILTNLGERAANMCRRVRHPFVGFRFFFARAPRELWYTRKHEYCDPNKTRYREPPMPVHTCTQALVYMGACTRYVERTHPGPGARTRTHAQRVGPHRTRDGAQNVTHVLARYQRDHLLRARRPAGNGALTHGARS